MLIFIQIPPLWPCPVCWLLFLFIAGTSLELLRLNVGNEGGPDTIKTNGRKETSGVPLYWIRVSSLCIFHNLSVISFMGSGYVCLCVWKGARTRLGPCSQVSFRDPLTKPWSYMWLPSGCRLHCRDSTFFWLISLRNLIKIRLAVFFKMYWSLLLYRAGGNICCFCVRADRCKTWLLFVQPRLD